MLRNTRSNVSVPNFRKLLLDLRIYWIVFKVSCVCVFGEKYCINKIVWYLSPIKHFSIAVFLRIICYFCYLISAKSRMGIIKNNTYILLVKPILLIKPILLVKLI